MRRARFLIERAPVSRVFAGPDLAGPRIPTRGHATARLAVAGLGEKEASPRMGPASTRAENVRRSQFADLGTCMPCLTWCGLPLLFGATSKSKIALGM